MPDLCNVRQWRINDHINTSPNDSDDGVDGSGADTMEKCSSPSKKNSFSCWSFMLSAPFQDWRTRLSCSVETVGSMATTTTKHVDFHAIISSHQLAFHRCYAVHYFLFALQPFILLTLYGAAALSYQPARQNTHNIASAGNIKCQTICTFANAHCLTFFRWTDLRFQRYSSSYLRRQSICSPWRSNAVTFSSK